MADIPSNTITVTNGTLTPYITSTVVSTTEITYTTVVGNTLTITANYIPGKRFVKWTSSSLTFTDETAETTTVTPPSLEGSIYSITATYTDLNYLDKDGLTTLVANIKNELATRDSQITALQNENAELLDQIPTGEAAGELINLQDSSNLPIKDFAMLGNATQVTTSISGGDEYNSPSPDHPQDIHVVTGDNTVKVLGKNLLNIPNDTKTNGGLTCTVANGVATASGTTSQNAFLTIDEGINLTPGTYTLSANNNQALGTGDMLRFVTSGGADTQPNIRVILNSINNSYTFSLTQKLENVKLQIRIAHPRTISTSTPLIIKPQLEVGSTATPYEPYHEEALTLSLGDIELAKIGDYTDRIFKAVSSNNPLKPSYYDTLPSEVKASLTVGKWYKQGNIGKYTFTGNESGNLQTNNETTYLYNISGKTFNVLNNTTNYINNYSLPNSTSSAPTNTNLGSYIFNSTFRLRVPSSIATTYEQFQTWLSSANCIIYFALSTPTYTEITDTTLISQLENIFKMHTNKNVTNASIEPTGTNAQASSTLTYRQDEETLFNNLKNAILSLGGNV